ncbi:MAG: hypothetical protein CMP31_04220 [Roseibacillus sp.]|nr:hypothetical protein [Roseibacillus sp.]
MAAEATPDYKIEILGINWNLSDTSANNLVSADNDLPWLQDTVESNVRESWSPVFRDVIILNPANERPIAAFNLTTYNLALEVNRTQLKALLLSIAELEDADGDSLSDFWEDEMFGGDYSPGPLDDTDGDSSVEMIEYALGAHSGERGSQPHFTTALLEDRGDQHFSITFRRRLGSAGGLRSVVEMSEALGTWSSGPDAMVEVSRVNPYDGTGTEFVTYRTIRTVSALPGHRFFRVRCNLPVREP